MKHEWSQEERDSACALFPKMGMYTSPKTISDKNLDIVIELACQGNMLRSAALKALATGCGCYSSGMDDWHAPHCAVPDLREALSRSEVKK